MNHDHGHRISAISTSVHARARAHGHDTSPFHAEIVAHLQSPSVTRVLDLATGRLEHQPQSGGPDLTPEAARAEGHRRLVATLIVLRELCAHVAAVAEAREREPDPLCAAVPEFLDQLIALHG